MLLALSPLNRSTACQLRTDMQKALCELENVHSGFAFPLRFMKGKLVEMKNSLRQIG